VFLKTKSKLGQSPVASTSQATKPEVDPAGWARKASDAEKAEAEKLKAQGNSFMSSKRYDQAIDAYTKAIAIDGNNAVYFSNRAAAYSSKGEHSKAVNDAQAATRIDPLFTKGYNRLG
jgi:small glutamine-rich tetratricopeptide repeat-containing protein alpha